jgi:hypothetical protein
MKVGFKDATKRGHKLVHDFDYQVVLNQPYGFETPSIIKSMWSFVNKTIRLQKADALRLKYTQMSIMLMNYHAWGWLQDISHALGSVALNGSYSISNNLNLPHWMVKLAKKMKTLVIDERAKVIELALSDYNEELGQRIYKRKRKPLYPELFDKGLGMLILEIDMVLEKWLGFPDHDIGIGQYVFIKCILKHWGCSALGLQRIVDSRDMECS